MGGEVTTKLLVVLAGLIACGACVSPLLFDPAVEEAEEEGLLDPDRDPAGFDADGVLRDREGAVIAPVLGDEPERAAVPFFVTVAALLVALVLTGWAVATPAAKLARPALIAGVCVLVGTALAWAAWVGGVSEFPMTGTPLIAWLSVGLTLLAAWLVMGVLARPSTSEAVPG